MSTADLTALEQRATAELAACADDSALRAWNTKYFGKQGEIALALRRVGEVPVAERKTYGQEAVDIVRRNPRIPLPVVRILGRETGTGWGGWGGWGGQGHNRRRSNVLRWRCERWAD